jgi:hypothetical protein
MASGATARQNIVPCTWKAGHSNDVWGLTTRNNGRQNMKTLVATVALAAVIASPAFAQTRRAPAVQQYPSQYDQPYGSAEAAPRANKQANSVYENG